MRTRVVALLLGDGGDTGIDATTLADVEGIVAAATAAFERLIVRRKLKGSVQPPAGAPASLARPNPLFSMPPPTKLSQLSDRPAVEELAPPIRDLLTEPISRVGETHPRARGPDVLARGRRVGPRWSAFVARPNVPPPANVLAVRRPSGRPIPREEPDSQSRMPAVTAMSNLGTAAQEAIQRVSGTPGTPPASVPPRSSRRRGEAPKLDFGAMPPPSSMFGSEAPRRQRSRTPAHRGDPGPHVRERAGHLARHASAGDRAVERAAPGEQRSRASAFAEGRVAAAPARRELQAADTDTSPIALQGDFAEVVPASAPASSEMVSADDSDVDVVDAPEPPRSSKRTSAPPTPWPSAMDAPIASTPHLPPMPESSTRMMPVSEQQISVAAHRPPSSRSDHTRILPSVIVDVASEYVGLVERVVAGTKPGTSAGHTADDAETELLRAGGYAMPAIMARFPGPVTIEPDRLTDGPLPRVAECGPVLRLVASQRRTALPFVLSHVEDPDVEKRFWATYLLTELLYPDVLDPIVQRVFDAEPRVRRAARAAARAFAEGHPKAIVERLELVAMDGGEALDRRVLAIEALGETREALAVPALIPLLDDPDPQVVTADPRGAHRRSSVRTSAPRRRSGRRGGMRTRTAIASNG